MCEDGFEKLRCAEQNRFTRTSSQNTQINRIRLMPNMFCNTTSPVKSCLSLIHRQRWGKKNPLTSSETSDIDGKWLLIVFSSFWPFQYYCLELSGPGLLCIRDLWLGRLNKGQREREKTCFTLPYTGLIRHTDKPKLKGSAHKESWNKICPLFVILTATNAT